MVIGILREIDFITRQKPGGVFGEKCQLAGGSLAAVFDHEKVFNMAGGGVENLQDIWIYLTFGRGEKAIHAFEGDLTEGLDGVV